MRRRRRKEGEEKRKMIGWKKLLLNYRRNSAWLPQDTGILFDFHSNAEILPDFHKMLEFYLTSTLTLEFRPTSTVTPKLYLLVAVPDNDDEAFVRHLFGPYLLVTLVVTNLYGLLLWLVLVHGLLPPMNGPSLAWAWVCVASFLSPLGARPFYGSEFLQEQFKQWLKSLDKNSDGRISKQELREALRSTGQRFARWKAWRAIKNADLNRNNFIDGNSEIEKLMSIAAKWWIVAGNDDKR
ncbi:hypothetical protein MA16_Dca021482 [Dendrobium catenatum]|uniref:EF-hand domain-containing protein n=1 Tax=Dendrobium catenatum TaxID=906689 RepID=A0A2I0WZ81_9ASPA|nr:hypothetical protein MA16_Dca021482 [Dendrobium catenatum]